MATHETDSPVTTAVVPGADHTGQHFARMLRGSALPTLVAGVGCLLVAGYWGGREALAAGLGVALVVLFFSASLFVMQRSAHLEPTTVMVVVLTTYTVKILALGLAMVLLRDAAWLSGPALAMTVIVCTMVWLAFELRAFTRLRVPVTDPPSGTPPAVAAPGSGPA